MRVFVADGVCFCSNLGEADTGTEKHPRGSTVKVTTETPTGSRASGRCAVSLPRLILLNNASQIATTVILDNCVGPTSVLEPNRPKPKEGKP